MEASWKSKEFLDALRSYFDRLKVPDMTAAKNDVIPVVNKIVNYIKSNYASTIV